MTQAFGKLFFGLYGGVDRIESTALQGMHGELDVGGIIFYREDLQFAPRSANRFFIRGKDLYWRRFQESRASTLVVPVTGKGSGVCGRCGKSRGHAHSKTDRSREASGVGRTFREGWPGFVFPVGR